ncbi:ADP-heptose--LPS heptosyltransferase 2 [Sinobacterium norvegicum]|uniref:lipopolysaccharide heptosyltransferase II n=1 Tax=Sinobacterium norvegicum TaxID=1641715 RepID=A0ABN8EKB8_9GAMM|nr:lipopolysaccharide heptosyltransferase II [Sinobacterium norvegicum]CAH0992840.1 ADP-heptose--LPS heptosyltransferase 2 [Sinobacterium norvegicum]
MVSKAEKIFIVGPSWVGDMVMAQSLFKVLCQRYPNCEIHVLAPDWSRPVLERMPEVAATIVMPVGHGSLQLKRRYRLGKQLREEGYSQAYVLPNSLKSALIPAFAEIPKRVGWRGEYRYGLLNDIRLLNKKTYPLMVERFVALALPVGQPLPAIPNPQLRADGDNQQQLIERHRLDLAQPVLSLCPGAEFGPAKRWPSRHYAALADMAAAEGMQIWLFGSAKDRAVTDEIVTLMASKSSANIVNMAGETALGDSVDLLALSNAVVSNDSGLMHIAAAVSVPLVSVYGSTSPEFTPPLSDAVAVIASDISCRPCFKRECPLTHMDCLNKLEPATVFAGLQRLLANEEPA